MYRMKDTEQFINALCDENTSKACRLIRQGRVNPNGVKVKLMPALHYCCYWNYFDVIKVCFEHVQNIDVDKQDRDGDTMLHLACRDKGDVDLVRFLVHKARCNVEARNQSMCTPLHAACHSSNLEVVRWLVEQAGANVDAKDHLERSPLRHLCAREGLPREEHDEFILYMAKRAQVDPMILKLGWFHGLSWVCKQTLVESVAKQQLKMSQNYVSNYPLHTALRVRLGWTECYHEFIEKSPPHAESTLNPDGLLPLHVALSPVTITKNASVALALFNLEPRSAAVRNSITGFYPFEEAATRTAVVKGYVDDDNGACSELELVYTLFRYDPRYFLTTRHLCLDETWRNERRVRQKTIHH